MVERLHVERPEASASEDHPLASLDDKAPFSARTLDWSSGKTVDFRIKVTVFWYHHDGSVMGTLDHWYYLYDASYGASPAVGYCANKIAPL